MRNTKEMSIQADGQRLDTACLWITKVDRNLSKKEQLSLSIWLADSPKNVAVFLDVAQMWDKMHSLNRLADLFPKSSTVYQTTRMSKHWKGAIAASVALFLSVSVFVLNHSPRQSRPAELITKSNIKTILKTNVGGNEIVMLPDGSKLVLNTNTLANVRFSDHARIIELKRGEIHIDVAHDKSRPLSIIVAGKIIQAVGTAFNVEVRNNSIELIVTDGKVLVADIDKQVDELDIAKFDLILPPTSVAISKGEKINLTPIGLPKLNNFKEEIIHIEPIDIAASLSWRTGNLIFRGESLAEAMNEISRYSNMSIELDNDNDLKKIRVAGMFKTGDISGLLYVLEQNFNIHHTQTDEHKIFLELASK